MAHKINKDFPKKDYVFIYTLSDPDTNEIRYVGKTSQSLYERYCEHISFQGSRNNLNYHSKNWIKNLKNKNKLPKIELIDEVLKSCWEDEEIFYISYLKYLGYKLTNSQIGGGSGNTGRNWKLSSEQKLKIKNKKLETVNHNYKLVDTQGNLIKIFKHIDEASKFFNKSYKNLYNAMLKKSLINKQYFILKKSETFSTEYLKRTYRKIKIYNFEEVYFFETQKQAALFLNIKTSNLNRILNSRSSNNTNYQIEKI